MHRQTPLTAGFVGYTSGGARTLIDSINDGTMMQEMKGTMMFGEARDRVESPQNYGFSSVVLPATKGKDGRITDSAEGFMSFIGGNRSFAICSIMDDRRHRPYGLKPGENAQYDDLGQMTILRRTGLYLLTTDNPDTSQQQSGGGAAPGQQAASSQPVQRFVSIRHVVKQTQPRKTSNSSQGSSGNGSGSATPSVRAADASSGGSQSGQDFKHEGDTVNTEARFTAKNFEFRTGDTVVGSHDKAAAKWEFGGKVHSVTSSDQHSVSSKQVNINGSQNVSISGSQGISLTGPTTVNGSPVATSMMFDKRDSLIAALEARVATLESRINA